MSDPLPVQGRVEAIRRLSARLVDHDWTWARENADLVARNWTRRKAERPGIFDGTVLLGCHLAIVDGTCTVGLFATRYACFLAYRDAGSPDGSVFNAFAAVVPHTADGAVLLGEMGPRTANAGQVYFPCGTPDLDDVRGRAVDLAGSAAREFREETGLGVPEPMPDTWLLVRGAGQCAFLLPVRFPEDAEPMRVRIEDHCTAEACPELARIVVARGLDDIDRTRMPPFVVTYLERLFQR